MKIFQKFQLTRESFLEYGIYLLIFLSPLQTRFFLKEGFLGGTFWEYGTVSLYLSDILILFFFFFSTIEIVRNRKAFKLKKIWFLLAFFELFIFISIFFATVKYIAIYGYIRVLLAFVLFFLISETKLDNKKLTLSFLSATFLQSLVGIFQFFNNYSWPNKYLGMAKHDPAELGTFVIELEDKSRILRAYGGLDHPNIYGFFIFVGIFVFVKYLLTLKNRKNISFQKQSGYFLILSLFFFSLLLSFSRAVYLVFIFYFLFLMLWSFYNRNGRELIYKILFSFSVIFLITFSFYSNLFLQRFNFDSRLENISNNERVEQLKSSKDIFLENELFGVGIGNYTSYLFSLDGEGREAWNYQPVHNIYLLVLSEIGIIGFLSFLSILVYFLYSTFNKRLFFDFFLILTVLLIFFFDH
ncbi:MAG: O-antigen ligase family protein, partial [Bacteroidales bacterium]|nr:O-antigen ligase family protein [Bacteroidales bacterium]